MSQADFTFIEKLIEKDGWSPVDEVAEEGRVVYRGKRAEYELAFSNWGSDDCQLALNDVSSSRIATAEKLALAGAEDPGDAVRAFLEEMHYRYLD